ncbi:MAG: hypothetical protein WKF77_19195 [Planctomycetaceae bacterium]
MSAVCECRSCGKQYRVGPQRAGTTIKCHECGADIRVPRSTERSSSGERAAPMDLRPFLVPAIAAFVCLLLIVAYLVGKLTSSQSVTMVVPSGDSTEVSSRSLGSSRQEPAPPTGLTSFRNTGEPASVVGSENGLTFVAPATAAPASPGHSFPSTASAASGISGSTNSLPESAGAKNPLNTVTPPSADSADVSNVASAEWGKEGSVIPFDGRGGITVGPPGCPVIVSGRQVWDKQKQTITGELEGTYEGRGQSALSPDGRYFAAASKSPNQEETDIMVWDTTSGQLRFTAKGEAERYSDLILLSRTRLFVGGRSSDGLLVWDCETGEPQKSITVADGKFGHGSAAISQDGQYLAAVAKDRLLVLNSDTGRQVAVMGSPVAMPRDDSGQAIVIKDNKVVADSRAGGNDNVFVYAWLQSLEFSPDTQELAGVSTHPRPRVMCWNQRGKLVFDQPIYTSRRAFWENTLQWFPDRSAWLIENEIFERESGRIVLSVRAGFGSDTKLFVYDDKHLLGAFPHAPGQLEVMEIPWDAIRKSLTHMKEGGAAWISPGCSVRIELNIGESRGNAQTTAQVIQASLTARLARDGIQVSPAAATVFRLKFAESAGEQLPIFERQSPFDFRGRDTGRTVTEATGSLMVELHVPGHDGPIWRDSLDAMSSRTFHEQITDETVRNSMLETLGWQVSDLNFPYFIPQSPELLALPVVID